MNKVIISIVAILMVLFMFNYLNSRFSNIRSFNELSDREKVVISFEKMEETFNIKNKKFTVEVVNSAESVRSGLSDRDEIGSDGMLFVFPSRSLRTFWMLKMKFNLDFVWISGNRVVGLTRNIEKPDPGTNVKNLELISISKSTDKVLELNSGDINKYKIKVGDVVILK